MGLGTMQPGGLLGGLAILAMLAVLLVLFLRNLKRSSDRPWPLIGLGVGIGLAVAGLALAASLLG